MDRRSVRAHKKTDLSGRTALAGDFADTTAKYRKAEFEAASLSFSDHDINRTWTKDELATVSERQLTLLAFLRAIRNLAFFGIQALLVWALVPLLGWFGKIAGWAIIAQFAVMLLSELPAPIDEPKSVATKCDPTLIDLFAGSSLFS
jgi:hypothetical protein